MIKTTDRKCKYTELRPYCYLAADGDLIEVTEWINGEGYDITIISKHGDRHLSLTDGELQALNVLINYQGEK